MHNVVRKVAAVCAVVALTPFGVVAGAFTGHEIAKKHNQAAHQSILYRGGHQVVDTSIGGEIGFGVGSFSSGLGFGALLFRRKNGASGVGL